VPTLHKKHTPDPAPDVKPPLQLTHCEKPMLLNLPATQLVHVDAPAAENLWFFEDVRGMNL
jgi:hypothetical protein